MAPDSPRRSLACFVCAVLLWALQGCTAALPKLLPAAQPAELLASCASVFPDQAFRAVYSLDIRAPFGMKNGLIGVNVVDLAHRRIRAVLLTPEGVTLFDAALFVNHTDLFRAVPPLDKPDFVKGLRDDLFLLFLAPEGRPEAGLLPDGGEVCRYLDGKGRCEEVLPSQGKGFRIRVYDAARRLERRAEAGEPVGQGPAETMRVEKPGPLGYTISMRLLQWEPVNVEDSLFLP